jgi:hypothetical protein
VALANHALPWIQRDEAKKSLCYDCISADK